MQSSQKIPISPVYPVKAWGPEYPQRWNFQVLTSYPALFFVLFDWGPPALQEPAPQSM